MGMGTVCEYHGGYVMDFDDAECPDCKDGTPPSLHKRTCCQCDAETITHVHPDAAFWCDECEDRKDQVRAAVKALRDEAAAVKADTHNPVTNPAHYTSGSIECIDYIESVLSREEFIGYLRGQVIKYQHRLRAKGNAVEDCGKLRWYAERLEGVLPPRIKIEFSGPVGDPSPFQRGGFVKPQGL